MGSLGRRLGLTLGVAVACLVALGPSPGAQPLPSIRLALVSQWLMGRYPSPAALAGELPRLLDAGVTEGPVWPWQRDTLPRSALVGKPLRVLTAEEARPLGGRGEFALVEVRPPGGRAAWTEVRVAARTGQAGDVLVLEVGGELNTVDQVLAGLFVLNPDGRAEALPLAPRALVSRPGVPVVRVPFGRPVVPPASAAFVGTAGAEFLVARSPVETIVDGALTASGPADLSPVAAGQWREGDRVLVRLPLETLRAGAPAIVMVWKDRVYQSDPSRRPIEP